MSNFLPPAIIEIKAIADKAIAELKEVNKELDKMDGTTGKASAGIDRMQKASKLATGALLGMGTAFAGFAAIGIKEALEAESVMTKLGTTMSAAGVNTAKNRQAVKDLTSSYIDLGFADDAAAAGLETLLRTTGDLDQSQKLLALSADVARTKGIGLAEASGILAKASMGNAKAFKEMGIELDTTLPKSKAIAKAMDELNAKVGTQAENATKTFAVQMQIVRERFNDTAESLGTILLPMIKDLLETMNRGIKFIQNHATAFKILGGIFLTVTVALAAYNATIKVQMALTKAWSVITAVQKTATALLTGQQIALNTAMKLNPIGLIVSAAVLLIAALGLLWNKSETFRKGVIAVGKAGLMAFASIIPIIGQVGEAVLKFVLTPMKTLLSALSHLPGVGKYAKAGLDLLNKGLDGISDFADKASAKAKTLADNLDKLNKPIKFNLGGGVDNLDVGGNGKGSGKKGLTPEEIKAAKDRAKAIQKENEDALKVVKDLNEKLADAKKKFTDRMAEIDKNYTEKTAKLNKDAADKIAKLDKTTAEKRLKVQQDYDRKRIDAQNKFNDTMGALNKKREDSLAKAAADSAKRMNDINKSGQDKLRDIIQQGINRLRDAYKTGTQFNVGDIFKGLAETGDTSAKGLLDVLKKRLTEARLLAENASRLASAGFSQTFIEQVVSQGPEIGNKMAESLLNASPETVSELQNTFGELEKTSDTALNSLGATFNNGIRFATAELMQAYRDAQAETARLLLEESMAFAQAQADIIAEFNAAAAEAEKQRDEILKQLDEDRTNALAEIEKDYADALEEINTTLADSLAEAFKDMQEAQDEARKQLTETLDDLQKQFAEKLGNIKNYVASTIAAIQALQFAMNNVSTMTTTPTPTATVSPVNPYGGQDRNYDSSQAGNKTVIVNAPITNNDTTTSEEMSQTLIRVAKYGIAVTI